MVLQARDPAREAGALRHSLKCANCNAEVSIASPYCSDFCRDLAGTVRYGRKATVEGRYEAPEVLEGFGTRFISLLKGGYPVKARALSAAQRSAVFERDGGKCRLCGARADQIDHISGHGPDPANLRAVCGPCNRRLAHTPNQHASPEEDAEWRSDAVDLCHELADRIGAPAALRACDDHLTWKSVEPGIRGARRRLVKERQEELEGEFEDVDGYLWHSMQKDD